MQGWGTLSTDCSCSPKVEGSSEGSGFSLVSLKQTLLLGNVWGVLTARPKGSYCSAIADLCVRERGGVLRERGRVAGQGPRAVV